MLAIALHLHQTPYVFSRFTEVVDEKQWRKVANSCHQQIASNPFLRDYLLREYAVVVQLDQLSNTMAEHGTLAPTRVDLRPFYPAIGLMFQTLSLAGAWPVDEARKLFQRVYGALKNPADMRGLLLELSVATHFSNHRWKVKWPETLGTAETFDLLVEKDSIPPLEVECKSIGEDKGCKVTRREALDFYKLLDHHLNPVTNNLSRGLSTVVTVPARLPTTQTEREALAHRVGRAIFRGSSCVLLDGTDVRISDFQMDRLGIAPNTQKPSELRATLDAVTCSKNRQVMLIGTRAGGALAIAIQSARDDQLLESTFDTLSDAATNQLTGRRAGMLVAEFVGLDAQQMYEIGMDEKTSPSAPSPLRIRADRFLRSEKRDFITGVAFFSRPEFEVLESLPSDKVSGTAYYFPKKDSPMWVDGYSRLFHPYS